MRNIMQTVFSIVGLFVMVQVVAVAAEPAKLPRISGGANVGFQETFAAIEAESLRISLSSSNYGFVEGKVCDACEEIKVNITPSTKAYAGKSEVSLKQAKNRIGRYATVIFDLETKNVSAIRW